MSKPQKIITVHVSLNLSASSSSPQHQSTPSNSPKPPIQQKSFKSPKGDSSFRVITPKMPLSKSNSQKSLSKNSSPIQKQMSMPESSQDDAIIEKPHIIDENALPHINKELTAIEDQISNAKIIDINSHVLKQWQSELLKSATRLITINNQMIREQPLNINKQRNTNEWDLEEKLMEEKKKRLAAEEQSSKIIQDQEKQIGLLVIFCKYLEFEIIQIGIDVFFEKQMIITQQLRVFNIYYKNLLFLIE